MNERDANTERYDSLKVNDTFGERIAQSLFIGSDPSLLGFSLSYESITFANDINPYSFVYTILLDWYSDIYFCKSIYFYSDDWQ